MQHLHHTHTIADEELRAARARLLARETELQDRVRRVKDDLGRKITPVPGDAPDAAVVMENDAILEAIGETAESELQQIERALRRIDTGTYGVCDRCAKPIGAARLKVVPYTVHCMDCALDT